MRRRGVLAAVICAGLVALAAIGAHGAPAGKKDTGLGPDGALACMRGSRLDGGASAGACLAAAGTSDCVPGLGHAWSGGDPRATHMWPPGSDATNPILDFLLERS